MADHDLLLGDDGEEPPVDPLHVLREFVRERISGRDVHVSVVIEAALKKFLQDEAFRSPAVELWIRQNVPAVIGSLIHQSRPRKNTIWRRNMSEEARRARTQAELEKWYEPVEHGHEKRFPDLVPSELRRAIDLRRRQVEPELRLIDYQEEVYRQHPKDNANKTVRESVDYVGLWIEMMTEEEEEE